MTSLCEELPYWEILSNEALSHIILNDGSLATGLEITPLDIECFDNERLNQLTHSLRGFVNSCPEHYTFQMHVRVDSDFRETLKFHENLVNTQNDFLKNLDLGRTKSIGDEIEENKLNRARIFLYIKSPAIKATGLFGLKTVKKFSADFEKDFESKLEELFEYASMLSSSLTNLGFRARALSKDDLVENIYRHLNPKRSQSVSGPTLFCPNDIQFAEETLKKEPELAISSPRSQLVFGDLILDKDEFLLDQYRTRVLSLKTLPELTIAGQMDGFLRFPFHYDLLFTFKVSDQAQEMRKLEQKRRMAHSLSQTRSGQVSDLESESRLSTTEDLIRELIETGQHIFVSELLVILREENSKDGIKKLNQKTREVLSRFKSLSGSEGVQETVGAWKIFKSGLPGAPIVLERGKRMKTSNLVDFLPLYGPRLGDDKPKVLVHSRLDSLISLDPYDSGINNYNSLVTGSSGSGKSFFNNFLLLQQLARGVKVFIIDVGGSYKKLTEILKGQYFEVKLSDEYAINPFEIKDIQAGPNPEKIKALGSIIEQMVSEENLKLSKFERVLIEKAITETFERLKLQNKCPILSDFEKTCKNSKEPELLKISKLLYSWIGDSAYGKLLDRNFALKTNSPVTTFDLKGLSQYPDLQSVMILILTNFILDQVENDKNSSKRVILDEAWQFLQSQAASNFMEYAARTFRKTGSGITFITQGVEEIAQSSIGSAIINNTATKVVMSQRGDIKLLTDTLKLNSREVSLIQSLEQRKGFYSEAFLIQGDHRQVIRIYPSPLEYWISTSDANDNNFLTGLNLDLEEALLKASEIHPYGVATPAVKAAV